MMRKKNKSVLKTVKPKEEIVAIGGRTYLKREGELTLLYIHGKCINHPEVESHLGTDLCDRCLIAGGYSIGQCIECGKKVSQRAQRCKKCANVRFKRIIERNNYHLRVIKMNAKGVRVRNFIKRDFSDLED